MAAGRLLVLLLAALVAGACAPPSPPTSFDGEGWGPSGDGSPAGGVDLRASAPPPVPRPTALPAAARQPWPHAAEVASLSLVPGRGPSEHLDGAVERTVLVNEAASGYLHLVRGRPLPAGAIVAQRHHPRGSEDVTSWYVMRKDKGERWSFWVLDPELRVATTREAVAPCARCHVEAPYQGLFGPPEHLQAAEDMASTPASSSP